MPLGKIREALKPFPSAECWHQTQNLASALNFNCSFESTQLLQTELEIYARVAKEVNHEAVLV